MVTFCRLWTPFLVAITLQSAAQCINTFPYTEDFETNNGNWVSGGTGNDWAWGSPTKAIINSAFSGNNCWVVGGLTNSFYNLGERSYIESPCFNFTNLQYPYVSFAIFWESERTFDGLTFQYSTDNGNTWNNVGSINDPNDCLNQNWFNTPNINNLTGLATLKEGWAGNIQSTVGNCQGGSGSNGWRLAEHCMSNLSGTANVKFRFAFGAGTACNNYDGIAIDDVYIGEAPANTADFTYTCNGNSVSFSGITTLCPTTLTWNFGDGTTASGLNVNHTYVNPGNYTVSFTASGPCNAPATSTKTVSFLALNTSATPESCPGANDGTASVIVSGNAGAVTYSWSTSPAQNTATAQNLTTGNYSVSVSGGGACSASATVNVGQNLSPVVSLTSTADTCGAGKGTITATVAGSGTYTYNWSNGTSQNPAIALLSGNYSVTATNANGCSASATTNVPYEANFSIAIGNVLQPSCPGSLNGEIGVTVQGGTPPFTYIWSNGSNASTISDVDAGTYTITVIDGNTCSATGSEVLSYTTALQLNIFTTNVSCDETNNGTATVEILGGTSPFSIVWSNNTNTATIQNLTPGTYAVTVSDANNCTISESAQLQSEECTSFIYFPTAFTPNGDGVNEVFRPRYSFDLGKYSIRIYNRWGELVYTGTSPMEGWDGFYKEVKQPMGVYVFTCDYAFSGKNIQLYKGNFTLLY